MNEVKKIIRTAIRQLNRHCLVESFYVEHSAMICAAIKKHPQWAKAQRIGLYHALPDEPSLLPLFTEFSETKELFLPRVESSENIAFYPYTAENQLALGAFGIAEPSVFPDCAINPASLDLIIVPGVAFTKEGVRMGRGKGYYDRYLKETSAYLLGVTFRYRLLPSLPSDPWDYIMDDVLTD